MPDERDDPLPPVLNKRGVSTTVPLDVYAVLVHEAARRDVPLSTVARDAILAAVDRFPRPA